MSVRPGDDWWLGSDGRWYPPESRPATEVRLYRRRSARLTATGLSVTDVPPGAAEEDMGDAGLVTGIDPTTGEEAFGSIAPTDIGAADPVASLTEDGPAAPDDPSTAAGAAGGLRSLRTPQGVVRTPDDDMAESPADATATALAGSWSAAPVEPLDVEIEETEAAQPPAEWPAEEALEGEAPTGVATALSVEESLPALRPAVTGDRLPGWGVPQPGVRLSPASFAKATVRDGRVGGTFKPKRSGNIGWSLARALAAGAVLAFTYGQWYQVLATLGNPVSGTIATSFQLMAANFGEWRVMVPVTAGMVAGLSLLAAVGWRRGRYPRMFTWLLRVVALGVLGSVIASLILRIPEGAPSSAALQAAAHAGVVVVFSYHLGWAAWGTLLAAVATFLLALPVAVRIR